MAKFFLDPFVILLSVIALSGCSIRDVYIHHAFPAAVTTVPDDSIQHTIFLIGDAGEPMEGKTEETFRLLTQLAAEQPVKRTIIFLGDNLYPKGLPTTENPERNEMERRLDGQIAIGAESGARTIFVPGNHDWEYQGKNGYDAIRREEEYIRSKNLSHVSLLPTNGTPGPHGIDIGEKIRIIAIDTQWWLHAYEKPFYPGDTTEAQTRHRWLDSLSFMLGSAGDRAVIIAAHHPLKTHGEHGGFFDWKDHIFPLRKLAGWLWVPLPGLGSLYPLSRMWGISDQDLSGKGNIAMVRAMDSLLSLHQPVAYAAGHEHTLQVLNKQAHHYYLVSGNGITKHNESLTDGDDTILASRDKGFMRMDILVDGRIRLGVIASNGVEIFSMMLR